MSKKANVRANLINVVSTRISESVVQKLFLENIASAEDSALQSVIDEVNRMLWKTQPSPSEFFAEINRHLGIMRQGGIEVYLIKDRREWLSNGLVEVWKKPEFAIRYLKRKSVPFHGERVNRDGVLENVNYFLPWLSSPEADSYAGVTFHPEGGSRYRERFNLWNGWGCEPSDGTKHEIFLRMLRDGFCGGSVEYYEYLLSWLAHLVQKPAERPGTAIAIVSHQGAGKGTFIEVLTALVGEHNCSGDISNKDLMGGFNSKIAHKLLINLNEATFSGNHEQVEFMKKLITDPTFRCEFKGLESFDAPNYSRLIVTTNNTNWGRLDADDRRYLVLEPSPDFPQDPDFFRELRRAMFDEGGVANLFHFLKQLDISNWRAMKLPARTTGFDTLEDSMTNRSDLKFFYELAGLGMIETHRLLAMRRNSEVWYDEPSDHLYVKCGDTVSFANLYDAYVAYCDGNRRMVAEAKNKFSMTLGKVGGHSFKKLNHTMVKLPSRDDLRVAVGNILGKWKLEWAARFPESRELIVADDDPEDLADAKYAIKNAKLLEAMKL